MRNAKDKARGRAQYLQHIGAILRPVECADCGQQALLEKHHPDYGKPDEVVWVCRPCHVKRHARHVRRGVAIAAGLLLIASAMVGCQGWEEYKAAAAAAGQTTEQKLTQDVQGAAAFLPSPWREIIIGAAGLGGIVWQTVGKSKLKKKLQTPG